MRSRKLAGRLRAVRFSLTSLHWGPMWVPSLIPGSSWEKAGETILSSSSSTQKSFLWTDLHLQSPSCDANLPSKTPPRQGLSEPPPLPLCLEAAVFQHDASLRLIGTDAFASREDLKASAERRSWEHCGMGLEAAAPEGCVHTVGGDDLVC